MKLSLYAICKDEAGSLPGMVESVRSIIDDIVIVDTGSSDDTVNVAKSLGAKVLIHPRSGEWRENPAQFSFAEARNFGLDECKGDWILMLDCDERMSAECVEIIKPGLESVPDEVLLCLLTMVMCHDDGRPYQEFLAERIFRGGRQIRFKADMHNFIDLPDDPTQRAQFADIRVMHNRAYKSADARDARCKQRIDISERYFKEQIEANGNDRRSMFYLAGTYFDAQRYDEAEEWFTKYLEVSDWSEERYQAAILLAQCYLRRGTVEEAKKLLSAHIIDNWARAEALMMLGQIAQQKGDFPQAEWWFKAASIKEKPIDPLFVETEAHTWGPHYGLYEVYQAMGLLDRAVVHAQEAVSLGCPNGSELSRFCKNSVDYPEAKRIAVLVDRGQMDFIQPVIEHWQEQGKEVDTFSRVPDVWTADYYDLVWCEWAGPLTEWITKTDKDYRIIVRVHGYELHSGLLQQVNWANVDDVIFVSRALGQQASEICPEIMQYCNCYLVPGGAETDKFSIGGEKQGNKITMVGYCNMRKNIPLALQILAELPDHELHIAGEWQDAELLRYVQHMAHEMKLGDRLHIYGRVDDLNTWFADKDFILSTSLRETFHYAVAEGMAAGLMPVVHSWESARDFYPADRIFRTVDEAVKIINEAGCSRELFRDYARDNLDIKRNLRRIDRIVKRPSVAVCGEAKFDYAIEYKAAKALETLGCRVNSDNPELVIVFGTHPRIEPWMDGKKIVYVVDDKVGSSERDVEGKRDREDMVKRADLVVACNPHWIQPLADERAKRVVQIPMIGAVDPFKKIMSAEKKYDVGFFGWETEHRKPKLEALGEKFNVTVLQGCMDHVQVNEFFNACKVLVNFHAYDDERIELRIAEAMSAGACIVSEKLPEGHPYPEDCFVESEGVATAVESLLEDEERREAIGHRAFEWIWSRFRLEGQIEKLFEEVGL